MAFPLLCWLSLQQSESSRYLFHLQALTGVMVCAVKPQLRTADDLIRFRATNTRLLQSNRKNLCAYVHIKLVMINYSTKFLQQIKKRVGYWHTENSSTIKLLSPLITPSGLSIPASPTAVSPTKILGNRDDGCTRHFLFKKSGQSAAGSSANLITIQVDMWLWSPAWCDRDCLGQILQCFLYFL